MEFREQQRGFQARLERWSDISRGYHKWNYGESKNSKILDIQPVVTGTEITQEGLYVNQHQVWQNLMLKGLKEKALKMTEDASADLTTQPHTCPAEA